jgi:hypothetical protein
MVRALIPSEMRNVAGGTLDPLAGMVDPFQPLSFETDNSWVDAVGDVFRQATGFIGDIVSGFVDTQNDTLEDPEDLQPIVEACAEAGMELQVTSTNTVGYATYEVSCTSTGN